MKNFYLIAALILIASTSFSQSYFVTTATKNGDFDDDKIWSIIPRNDGKKVNSVIIPENIVVSVKYDNDLTSFGDLELEISGNLQMVKNSSLSLTMGSKITLKNTGIIDLDNNATLDKKNKKPKYTQQIIIGGVVKFDGANEDFVSGNVFASQSTSFSPLGFLSNATLPVKFVSFSVINIKEGVNEIKWTTAEEVNNSHFEIERSNDGINWSAIATVFSNNDANSLHQYKFNDKIIAKSATYYRIRQVDFDGEVKYSSVRIVGVSKTEIESLVYVSGKNTVTVDLRTSLENNVMVRLISMNGVVVSQKKTNLVGEKIVLTANNAVSGMYLVQISDLKGMSSVKKVLL